MGKIPPVAARSWAEELADSLVQLSTRATRTANMEGEPAEGAGAADDAPVL